MSIDEMFESFPHKALPIPIARSRFFSAVVEEMHAHSEKLDGKRVLKLSELGNYSDDDLQPIIPMIVPKSDISLKDGHIVGKSAMTGQSYRLFSVSSPALIVFNMINGNNTVKTISEALAKETEWTTERSFAYTRGVFLSLVIAGLCVPKE